MPDPFRAPTCTCGHTAADHTRCRNLILSAPAIGRCLIEDCDCTEYIDDREGSDRAAA